VTSSPGGLTATGASSPIQIGGLTSGTAYTFTVAGQNPGGVGAASAASNSVTPYDGYESIATVYGNGSSGTLTFSSIPSGYTHLQVRALVRGTRSSTYDVFWLRFNNDSSGNYTEHQVEGSGTAASASGTVSGTLYGSWLGYLPAATNTANVFGVSIVDILDYANTNKYKTTRALAGADVNGSGYANMYSSLWLSTSAITTISAIALNGNFSQYSVIELYGIRG
jgi:hypothetical protein